MKRDQHKVQVWNDHDFAWEETFKGDKITIPAHGYKEMEFYEAYEFKGQIVPLMKRADETLDPKSQKKIRCLEADYLKGIAKPEADEDDGQEIFPCNMCKKVFTTEQALIKHSEAQHEEQMVVDADAERAAPKKRGRPAKTIEAEA